ncbi:MAG: 2-oxoacid:acceptor oxidoreductase subunit alpha [Chloroflexi bacterium]|nr:2-oxoacid:acceptor oxidoreductase subunit alpha [Chloroflexota bacterium]
MTEKTVNDLSIMIGGDAGQGVESSGAGFCLALARTGLQLFALQDYRSQICGGHNFYEIRISDRPLYSHREPIHVLIALTPESVALHLDSIAPGGAVILPEKFEIDEAPLKERGISVDSLPLMKIAEEHGNRLMLNTAALAATAALTGFPLEYMEQVIRENFGKKSAELADTNVAVARAAHELAMERFGEDFPFRIEPPKKATKRMLMNGNEAIALGALAGGCRFVSAYPMTPGTSIIEFLSALPHEYGVVAKHAEDEIAAVCMALGASFTGARAMTPTSGGGFSLMVEAVGLAGMTEVPLVLVDAQRGGPSTGLPTRTEQSDLLFTIHASQGEFPRIVTAPTTIEECFEAGWRAFNLADKYQCPVIIMTDTFLASSLRTLEMDAIDFGRVVIDRGATVKSTDVDGESNGYLRFRFSDDGISPRALPGRGTATITAASDEHDETGHITEDSDNRVRMMNKRMQKLETARAEMKSPILYGPKDADLTLVCWGSTFGACREAVDEINAEGGSSANVLRIIDLWPMREEEVREALESCKRRVLVEQNYTAQLGKLIRMTTGIEMDDTLTKFDGRPFSPPEIKQRLGLEAGSGNEVGPKDLQRADQEYVVRRLR